MSDTKLDKDSERRAQREEWEDQNLTTRMECPLHPHSDGYDHEATLFLHGHRYAGTWECDFTGESDSHDHDDIVAEMVEVDTMRNGEHDTYLSEIHVCATCGVQVEW